jgi:hypothetical protein
MILSITLLFSTGYARDIPQVMPSLTVTGLVTGLKIKNATIINDRIAYEGDIFEVDGDKLGAKVWLGGRVKMGPILLQIGKITDKGVTVHYSEKESAYIETKFIPIKTRN